MTSAIDWQLKMVLGCVVGAALYACAGREADTEVACADYAAPGITVMVLDGISHQSIAAPATVVARDGAFADTARSTVAGYPYALAYERSGTYTVTVAAAGYQPWQLSPVAVSRDACHVITMPLVAYVTHVG